MKFKFKELSLGAGRPVAFLNEKNARELNVHVGDRIEVSYNGRKLIAIVYVLKKNIKKGEIYLSEEIVDYLRIKNNYFVDAALTIEPKSSILIAKKLRGQALTKKEIYLIVNDMVNNVTFACVVDTLPCAKTPFLRGFIT